MGWLFYTDGRVQTYADEKAEIARLCTSHGERRKTELVKACKVGSTWYAAAKVTNIDGTPVEDTTYMTDADGSITFAAVFLTGYDDGCWGYKDMEESAGPVESRAFLHVLVAPAAVIISGKEYGGESDRAVRIGDIGRVLDRGAVAIGNPSRCIPGGANLAGLDQFSFARVALKGAEPGNFRFLIRVGFDAAVGVEQPSHLRVLSLIGELLSPMSRVWTPPGLQAIF